MSKIDIKNLCKSYDDNQVFQNINLSLADKGFLSIVGPSGCGKSTLLRILLGQEVQDAGDIFVDDRALDAWPTPDRGIVFQRYSVMPHMRVLANVMLGLELRDGGPFGRLTYGRKAARDDAMTWLEAVGLAPHAQKFPHELSGGMQQRLALAQAMIMKPRVLLLDEPFGALDPGIRGEMHRLLVDLWQANAMTIVMVSHDLKEAFSLGTKVIVMDKPDPARPAVITYELKADQASTVHFPGRDDILQQIQPEI